MFGWDPAVIPDPESVETFERSKLRWDEVHEGAHAEMLEWFRALIDLRRRSTALNDGDLGRVKVQFNEDKRWMVVDRGSVKVMFNLGAVAVELENPGRLPLVLASGGDVIAMEERVILPPDRLVVFSSEKS